MKHRKVFNKLTRSLLAVLLALSLGVSIAPKAHAQLVTASPDLIAQMTADDVIDTVKVKLKDALIAALSAEMVNLLSMMANELAYNSAVWIASGGNAESPLFNSLPPSDYFKYAGARVLSEIYNEVAIDNLEDGMFPTLNIYLPTDPEVLQAIRQGIKGMAVAPEISFEYPSIKDNWSAYLASLSAEELEPEEKTAMVLSVMSEAFDPDVNEMSAVTQLQMYAVIQSFSEAQTEETSLIANDGFSAIEHYITGQIETSAGMVRDELETAMEIQKELPFNLSTALMSNSDTLISIGINAGTIFTNTLFSELMNKIQGGLFEDIVFDDSDPFDPDSSFEYSRSRIAEIFKSVTAFKPLEITDYSLLSELATCPSVSRGASAQLYNCAIDSSFVSAIALSRAGNTITLQDAIDEGYVDGGWPLIPSADTARNQDPKCYTYGFCHSNIVKLRKARIISIGWEMAAESDHNSETDPVTLQEVIDGFYSCNSDGELDDEHPWCHLVDPNWVLKFPETQCRTLAYGQILSAPGTDQRAEECVDIQSCISEDTNGNCDGGYGYCVREQNTWKFRGSECPEHYASCMSFENQAGITVDFLTNTIDYGDCSASNMGCMWYATQKEDTDDVYDWPTIINVESADEETDAYQNRLYVNSEVESCESEDAGCEELYSRGSETTLNILSNSSFETDEDEDGHPDGWVISGTDIYDTDGDYVRSGADALHIMDNSGEMVERYGIVLNQTRYYALSFYGYALAGDQGYATLSFADEGGNALTMTNQSVNESCTGDDCSITCSASGDEISIEFYPNDSDSYSRFECIFTTPTLTDRSLDIYAKLTLEGVDVYMDDIMLEQDADTDAYADGYSEELSSVYMKVAPDYLGCTGSDDDAADCASYATMCSEQDAGCGEFTPVNGDPSVTAVVSLVDQCPSSCDGYDTYRQEATTYEPYGDFPLYFIPSSAEACTESDVGCTEFTNLDTEGLEYYTYLRTCVTESQARANVSGDQAATFYTWEGSDEEGYQLRTWRLIESDLDDGAYYNYTYATSGETDTRPGLAPCTNWVTGVDGVSCADDADGDAVIDTDNEDCDEHTDILTNPECREFYDTRGGIHYRVWDDTVTINDSCVSYRLTDLVGEDATDWEAACDAAAGYYDSSAAFCRFYGYNVESTECSDSVNGCREFTGGRSANSRLVLEDLFETGSLINWEADSASAVTLSNESVAVDGHSLKSEGEVVWSHIYDYGSACATEAGCDSSTGTLGGSCTVSYEDQYCGTLENELYTDKTYTLTFWAKGDTDVQVGFDIEATSSISIDSLVDGSVPSAELTSEWTYYSIGPFDMNANDYSAFGAGSVLAFVPDSTGDFYIDNVTLREGEDELTLIKDSWTTPGECDQSWEGETSAQFHLGCQEYMDQNGTTYYLRSFRDLCESDAVGCTDYYTTEQSDSEYVAVYNATCYNLDVEDGGDGEADYATDRTSCYMYANSGRTAFETDSPELCTIIAGKNSCQFDFEDWFIPQADISDETNIPELYHLNYGPDATFVKADTDVYMIYSEDLECSSSDVAGCTELGEPTMSMDHSKILEWTSVYYLNEPDDYDDILCSHDELFCRAFESTNEGTWYFKAPIGHECEYKTDVTISGESYTGWFREGTSDFCYGTGTCSDDDSVTCSKDSDCISSTYDYGTCNITDSDYLIGGTESGIWRNGDEDYDGWVGHCEAEYDGCSAFEDPLDVDDDEFYGDADGTMYYYIDDDQLDDDSLLSSQRCNGQVSQKEGCTLFYDNGDTSLEYNASASYVVSTHADEVLGEEPFSLVSAIDCTSETTSQIVLPDGITTYDPCASRCLYANIDLVGSTDDGVYAIGQSCYTDEDCPNYEGYTGDIVSGTCYDEIPVLTFSYTEGFAVTYDEMERLENDTNRVISVNQDRVCSEWLSCSSSYSIWDQDAGRYRTICDGIDLCTAYSAEGHPSFCSAWDPDDPAVVLDADKYVSRDVTWYGEEYSGYSVPDVLPLQHLNQIDIAAPVGYCDLSSSNDEDDSDWTSYHGEPCEDDSECGDGDCVTEDESEEDYRLGYIAGACTDEYSEDCAVGYCTDNGSACTDEDDCETSGAECVPGVCYTVGADVCNDDDDCDTASGEECLSGTCVIEGDYCDLSDLSCESGESCFTSVAYKQGSCYSGSCFLAMDGEPFEEAMYEGQACRAQPEINSPFGEGVISEWSYTNSLASTLSTTTDMEESLLLSTGFGAATPRSFLSGFGQVETCAASEDCVCSYAKVTNSGGVSVYLSPSSSYLAESFIGICSATSPVAGAICTDPSDCISPDATTAEADATCDRITEENTLYGLEGYCLERDTGLNIEGDQYTGACLTWFPVDQLSGATDLYAKYKTAGFFNDMYMCTYVSPYLDLLSENYNDEYGYSGGGVACAEIESSCNKGNQWTGINECAGNLTCPEGYFAILGRCGHDDYDIDNGSTLNWTDMAAQACVEAQNDCPYVCIPEDAIHASEDDGEQGESCYDDFLSSEDSKIRGQGWNYDQEGSMKSSNYTETYYYIWSHRAFDSGNEYESDDDPTDYEEFTLMLSDYDDCVSFGIERDMSIWDMVSFSGGSDGYSDSGTQGYRYLDIPDLYTPYPGCRDILQTGSSSDGVTAPLTSMFYAAAEEVISERETALQYTYETTNSPFGSAINPEQYSDFDQNDIYSYGPEIVASCAGGTSKTSKISIHDEGNDEVCDYELYNATDFYERTSYDPTAPDGRSYIYFEYIPDASEATPWDTNSEDLDDVFDRINQLFANPLGLGSMWTWPGNIDDNDVYTAVSDLSDVGDPTYDTTDYTEYDYDIRDTGTPPTVWAVDSDDCGARYCSEGTESAITLNNQSTGDQEGSEGFYRATIKFYAAADKDQLPLRRVIVDWGDGDESGSDDDENYYKNHRGLQDGTDGGEEDTTVLSKCSLDTEWGLTGDSCDPNYFLYQHSYRCTDPGGLPVCVTDDNGNLTNSPCSNDGESCIYQPRVHVRDNWGWCAGVCDEAGCFDAYGDLSSQASDSECSYDYYPEFYAGYDPWIYYDGFITVEE